MSALEDELADARREVAAEAADFLPDTCSFTKQPADSADETRDEFGEVTTLPITALSNIRCDLLALSGQERLAGGKVTENATAKLQLPATTATLLINGTYSGVIHAKDGNPATPEQAFQVAKNLTKSKDLFAFLAITIQ